VVPLFGGLTESMRTSQGGGRFHSCLPLPMVVMFTVSIVPTAANFENIQSLGREEDEQAELVSVALRVNYQKREPCRDFTQLHTIDESSQLDSFIIEYTFVKKVE
jgi:hypothetical protein